MKTRVLLVVTALLFFGLHQSQAQGRSLRVGYIDMDYILENVPEYKEAETQLNGRVQKWKSEIEQKMDFEKRIAKYGLKFATSKVPRPDFWSGFRIVPSKIEFWQKRDFRLHERQQVDPRLPSLVRFPPALDVALAHLIETPSDHRDRATEQVDAVWSPRFRQVALVPM